MISLQVTICDVDLPVGEEVSEPTSPGCSTQDVVRIVVETNPSSQPASHTLCQSPSTSSSSSTPTPAWPRATVQTPAPQHSPAPRATQTLVRKRKRTPTATNTEHTPQQILATMATLLQKQHSTPDLGQACAILVARTCEKLPFLGQIDLLQKLTSLMQEELAKYGIAQEDQDIN